MKKSLKVTAFVLVIVFLLSMLTLAFDNFKVLPIATLAQTGAENDDDRRVAEEISNMTGVTVEEILSVRNTGKSWNDVLNELKNGNYQTGKSAAQREIYLLQTCIEEKDLEKLRDEGFTDYEIQQAALLVERVAFQLQEIISASDALYTMPEIGSHIENDEDEAEKYRELASLFDTPKCMYLVLKLRDEFGSMDAVLDEYLFSIQAGLDMALYIADKSDYLKQRKEKEIEPELRDIITIRRIEEKLLELLNQKRSIGNTDIMTPGDEKLQKSFDGGTFESSGILPDNPFPEIHGLKPADPAESIMDEINILDPMKTHHGGM